MIARIATVIVTASVNPCFLKLFEDYEKISEGIENQVTHLSMTKSWKITNLSWGNGWGN